MHMHNRLLTRADAGELITRTATLGAQSWNEQERTLEVTFATNAPVERMDARGAFLERLDMNQDWSGFTGAPVLDSHKRGALGDVLGSVVSATTIGGEGRATIRISKRRKAESIVEDIKAGHVRGVSVGYRVSEWKDSAEGSKRVRTATKWQPAELSIVAVPADPGAVIRSQSVEQTTQQADPPITDRAATNVHLRSIARVAGVPQTWVDAQIDSSATLDQARASAFAALQARSEATSAIRVVSDDLTTDPAWRISTIGEAIHCRMSGATPSEAARPYANMSMVELARDSLRQSGLSYTGNPAAALERALISMSDLPAIMGDSVNRTMRQAYEAAPSGLKRVARQTTARDFRMKHRIQMSAAPTLQPVNQDGEFHAGAISDQEETYQLSTFGRLIGFTRQAFVDDDLGALTDITRRMGIAAANFESQFLVNLVQNNANMTDGHPVFSTQHSNLATTGAVLSLASISAARQAMRQQTEMSGQLINIVPKFILVPPALETLAEQVTTSIQAVEVGNVNVFSFLNVLVEPRLTSATKWWLIADPTSLDGLEFSYLEGETGPQIQSEVGFEVDGIRFRIRLDYGRAFVEPRGWYQQPGA